MRLAFLQKVWQTHSLGSPTADSFYARRAQPMKTTNQKKRWIKPALKDVPIFFECTCYAGAR